MRLVFRAGIDDRKRIGSHDIAVGAMKGEGTGVVGRQAHNAFAKRDRLAIFGREIIVENKRHGNGIQLFFGSIAETA